MGLKHRRQHEIFHCRQEKCLECGESYIPWSKDALTLMAQGMFGSREASRNWAVDRVFQDNVNCCSLECSDKRHARQLMDVFDRQFHKRYGKSR